MLEYRDAETNQIVKTIVDKAIKKKITPLKKAILKKREEQTQFRLARKEERRLLREALQNQVVVAEAASETEGFVTVDDEEGEGSDGNHQGLA